VGTLTDQVYTMLIIILGGILVGFIFDLYRVLRGFGRPGKYVTLVTDCLFWLVVTPIALIILVLANWGELRLYSFLGLLLGLIFYWSVLSAVVVGILGSLLSFLWRAVCLLGKALIFLVTIGPRLLYALVRGKLMVFRRPRFLRRLLQPFRVTLPRIKLRFPKLFRIRL